MCDKTSAQAGRAEQASGADAPSAGELDRTVVSHAGFSTQGRLGIIPVIDHLRHGHATMQTGGETMACT
jgi:hypothetical protein